MARAQDELLSTRDNASSSNSNSISNATNSLEVDQAAELDHKRDMGDQQHGQHIFDPYARAYVPYALKIINTLDGETIRTSPLRQINFDAYVMTHIGSDFLPPIPKPCEIVQDQTKCRTDDDDFHLKYEPYFRQHINKEFQAQVVENDGYSLYEHDAIVSVLPNQDVTCSVFVPGLRENSPYLEEGDIIDLRQLVYQPGYQDPRTIRHLFSRPGRPLAYTGLYDARTAPQNVGHWTGIILLARITHIHRKQEQLLLKLEGIKPHLLKLDPLNTIAGKAHCKFNIQFPLMTERYLPMQHVLPVIQSALIGNGLETEFPLRTRMKYSSIGPTKHWLLSMLFPENDDCAVQSNLNPGTFGREYYDPELNWEQKKAVESVCTQNYGTVPFLISGPPGTGKTKTLVEMALQLIHNVEGVSHILFCAPSDPAADTLVQRLARNCTPGELLRLNRTSRTFAEVPDAVLPFCYILDEAFSIPPFQQLMKFKVVVTTTRDASMLMYARVSNYDLYSSQYNLLQTIHPYDPPTSNVKLHWTALLVDEAAQAIEPEVLIPLSIIAPPQKGAHLAQTPLFVMAGDEYQLGPRLALHTSPLRSSLLARLFARKVYAEHPLARGNMGRAPPVLRGEMLPIFRPPFSNLIRNYRSHPAILSVPSRLFYADTLEHHASDIHRLSTWPGWRGKRWPVLFHNSSGEAEDGLEMDGGGWYNVVEAQIACKYAQSIVRSGLVQQKEICIMSPFKAQVNCLRKLIRKPEYGSLHGVDIGPTEVFQGLERGVVILCTTRSKERFVKRDQELGWGIVGMPNQLNVALTRAKFGLIIIGKRELLELDTNWHALMAFCSRNGLWEGKDVQALQGGETNRLERVLIAEEETQVDARQQRVLRVWDRGHSRDMGDEAMWADGMQAEEDDMGSTDDEDEVDDFEAVDGESTERTGANGLDSNDDIAGDNEEDYEYHEALTGLREHL